MRRIFLVAVVLGSVALAAGGTAAAADHVPSGQRILGHSVVEPVYDADRAGEIGFISTPEHGQVRAVEQATTPIYLPVYPVGSDVGALICPHVPVDTCPDHGPGIAGLAGSEMPAVYGGGVLGHDHVTSFHGPDYRVDREPVVVLFTSARAAEEHLLTRAAIEAAIARGDATAVPLPTAILHGALVSTRVWQLATPVQ